MLFWRKIGIRLLCHPGVGRVVRWWYGDRLPHRGFAIQTQGLAPGVIARIFWGKYERAELDFVARYPVGDGDIVELGASIGIVSLQLAARLAPGRKCVCVEAHPALLSCWQRNMTAAGLQPKAVLVHAAIDYSGRSHVPLSAGHDSLSANTRAGAGTFTVPATTLGAIVSEHGIGTYTLVSDIEGAEADLLFHDAAALRDCRQIVMELHPTMSGGRAVSRQELAERIRALGFAQIDCRGPVAVFARNQLAAGHRPGQVSS